MTSVPILTYPGANTDNIVEVNCIATIDKDTKTVNGFRSMKINSKKDGGTMYEAEKGFAYNDGTTFKLENADLSKDSGLISDQGIARSFGVDPVNFHIASKIRNQFGNSGIEQMGDLSATEDPKNKGRGGASTKKRRPRRGGRRLRQKSMKRNIKHRR